MGLLQEDSAGLGGSPVHCMQLTISWHPVRHGQWCWRTQLCTARCKKHPLAHKIKI